MLSLSATASSARRRHFPSRGDAWRRRKPAGVDSAVDLKRKQLAETRRRQFQALLDEQEQEKLLTEPRTRGIRTTFRLMTFSDEEEDAESDYKPEEEEKEEEGEGEEEEEEEVTTESEEQELDDDLRWWKSSEEKRRWEKRYRQADAAFRKKFGCGIDTPAHPETRRRPHKHKTRYRAYTFVLIGLVIAYLVQLALVYSASSWALSMVAWRPSITENRSVDMGDEFVKEELPESSIRPTNAFSPTRVPEHVRTGLHLCSTLARRVVKSEHDVTSTQHALRACDLAVKFAPLKSREAVEARVLRGDLRSLLSRFDGADEDYQTAQTLVLEMESSGIDSKLAPGLTHDIDLKVIANRWTQLYKTKSFKELRREAKALAIRSADQDGEDTTVCELAKDWLSAFKREKPILEVLTLQRTWTMRRLKYEALDDDDDDDDNTNPDAV